MGDSLDEALLLNELNNANNEFNNANDRSNEWTLGFHRDKEGKLYRISLMSSDHIKRTIKLFQKSDHDTLPLELELEYRERKK